MREQAEDRRGLVERALRRVEEARAQLAARAAFLRVAAALARGWAGAGAVAPAPKSVVYVAPQV